jgi:agmatinase
MIDSIINCHDIKKADSIILSASYDRTASDGKGCQHGPKAIINCLHTCVEFFDRFTSTEYTEHYKFATKDLGISNDLLPKEMVEKVRKEYYALINKKQFLMLLGGEHSVSIGALRAISEKFNPNEITFFQIDAHCDLRDTNFNASPDQSHISKYAHCCVARRAHEIGFHIVQAGIRSYAKEEHAFFSQNDRIVVFEWGKGKTPSVDEIINSVKTDKVYISLDVDGIDPSHMPATGTPVQGGLEWYYTIDLLREVIKRKEIIGADIVEVAPIEMDTLTEYGAAQLCYWILGQKLLNNVKN